jgi:hypothetical protein
MPRPVKLIVASDSGGGKTGAIASLCEMGLSVRVADLDNNSGILRGLVTDASSPYVKRDPTVGRRLTSVIPMTETRGLQNGKLGVIKATAWDKLRSSLECWKDSAQDLGPITSWTVNDVLVLDTFTRASRAAMNYHLMINGRLNQKPSLYDFGDAQGLLRSLLEIITAEEVQCNVIVNCHIDYGETKSGVPTEFPMSIGNALGPEIATYFGSLLKLENQKRLVAGKQEMLRVFKTVPTGPLGVKNASPYGVPGDLPIETGLADYFKAVRGT